MPIHGSIPSQRRAPAKSQKVTLSGQFVYASETPCDPMVEGGSIGFMSLPTWFAEEAAKLGLTTSAVRMRYYRGKYPNLQIHRLSARQILVNEL